jgi:hypothetical protein
MKAMRIIKKIQDKSLLIENLNEFKGKTVELIIFPIETEEDEWANLSMERLVDAYGAEEPDYSVAEVKERNPDYETG